MNLLKTKKGNYALLLTEGEVNQMKNVLLQGESMKIFELPAETTNPFKGCTKKTIDFIKEIIEVYGKKGSFSIDEKFQTIRFKHKILNIHSAIQKFEKEGMMTIVRDNNEQRKRIKAIQLNF